MTAKRKPAAPAHWWQGMPRIAPREAAVTELREAYLQAMLDATPPRKNKTVREMLQGEGLRLWGELHKALDGAPGFEGSQTLAGRMVGLALPVERLESLGLPKEWLESELQASAVWARLVVLLAPILGQRPGAWPRWLWRAVCAGLEQAHHGAVEVAEIRAREARGADPEGTPALDEDTATGWTTAEPRRCLQLAATEHLQAWRGAGLSFSRGMTGTGARGPGDKGETWALPGLPRYDLDNDVGDWLEQGGRRLDDDDDKRTLTWRERCHKILDKHLRSMAREARARALSPEGAAAFLEALQDGDDPDAASFELLPGLAAVPERRALERHARWLARNVILHETPAQIAKSEAPRGRRRKGQDKPTASAPGADAIAKAIKSLAGLIELQVYEPPAKHYKQEPARHHRTCGFGGEDAARILQRDHRTRALAEAGEQAQELDDLVDLNRN